MAKTTVIRREVEPGRRILVTSDIHANPSYLRGVLAKANFCDDDLLIICGDIVEKGPASLEVLRFVMELVSRGNTIALAGNVDIWRAHMVDALCEGNIGEMLGYTRRQHELFGSSLFEEMATYCGASKWTAEEILTLLPTIRLTFAAELDFIRTLPTILETQNYIFVHAGMHMTSTDCDLSDIDAFSFLKVDSFLTHAPTFSKTVVVGHWPVSIYDKCVRRMDPIVDCARRIISIDGGCSLAYDGQLNLLVIPDISCDLEEVSWIRYDSFPVCTAMTAQEASDDSLNITWGDNGIDVLEVREDVTFVKHKRTGRELWIPSDWVYGDHCGNATDYVLSVDAGDTLSVIRQTSRGIIAKKDGIVGWYFGEIAR